jgi:xeroderma pigmentosum group C-complementing protein
MHYEGIFAVPGLYRIARKLNIDCAAAVVGFNFGSMGAVPAIEGFVVCAEYEDTLREAWEAEQLETAKRAAEKREKRIYGNWRKLIKGLLIREKLAQKYEMQEESEASQSNKRRSKQRKTIVKRSKT